MCLLNNAYPSSNFSVFDIVSDILLFVSYMKAESVLKIVPLQNDSSVLNITGSRTCTLVEEKRAGFLFSCTEPVLAGLTLALIYWPALKIIGVLLGPRTAGKLGMGWSVVMIIVAVMVGSLVSGSNVAAVLGWFLLCAGGPMFALSIMLIFVQKRDNASGEKVINILDLVPSFLLFPFLLPCVPFIFIAIKLLSVLKPKNNFLRSQARIGSRGEAILEAGPQFVLQCYVVFLSLSPTWLQLISITTSALSLSLPNIEQYVTTRSEEFGPKSILKNIAVFLPASVFKILTVSILCVFLNYFVIVGVFVQLQQFVLAIFLLITNYFYNLREENCGRNQFWESIFLGWLTITSLGRGKTGAVYRLVTTLYWTLTHSLTLIIILVVCNTDPGYVVIGEYIDWSKLHLVKNVTTMNILLISTLCLGWVSLVLDVIIAAIKFRNSKSNDRSREYHLETPVFWDEAILLEGIKYNTIINNK